MNDRDEAPGERLDRQWSELLQELRLVQTGTQLLGGFLLTLPFQARFGELADELKWLYLAAVAAATLSTLCALTPVIAHRLLFRQHRKDQLVELGQRMAVGGLVLLASTMAAAVALIVGVVIGLVAGLLTGALAAVLCLTAWWLWPTWLAGRTPPSPSYDEQPLP